MNWVGYADDLAIFFEDISGLQRELILLDKLFQLSINTSKTKTMIFGREGEYPSSKWQDYRQC